MEQDCSQEREGAEYPWQKLGDLPLEDQAKALELHRNELLEESESEGISDQLAAEWFALLKERDLLLRKCLEQDNINMLDQNLRGLFKMLITVGKLDHTKTPLSLKQALCNVHSELRQYFDKKVEPITEKKVAEVDCMQEKVKVVGDDSVDNPPVVGDDSVDNPPPPPPLQPICMNLPKPELAKRVRLDDESFSESNENTCRRRKVVPKSPHLSGSTKGSAKFRVIPRSKPASGSKYTPRHTRTPKQADSEDLRRHLLSGREQLKSIPGMKRSPGGTPERAKDMAYYSDNPSDLVSVALQRKFYSVRRLYGSPIRDEDDTLDSREASFNISID